MFGEDYYSHNVQIIGAIFGLSLFIVVFFLVKARKIREKYALVWFAIALFITIVSIFRGILEWFSEIAGIYYAPSALFAVLICCAYLLLLNASISISTLKKQNKNLIQELGLLRLKVEELEKKNTVNRQDGANSMDEAR